VGGLPVAVADGRSGLLVDGHGDDQWADALGAVALVARRRAELAAHTVEHAHRFSWDRTTDALLDTYADAAAEFAGRQRQAMRAGLTAGMIEG
jgi:D-inositol-3-phosphate glycosyltransferase